MSPSMIGPNDRIESRCMTFAKVVALSGVVFTGFVVLVMSWAPRVRYSNPPGQEMWPASMMHGLVLALFAGLMVTTFGVIAWARGLGRVARFLVIGVLGVPAILIGIPGILGTPAGFFLSLVLIPLGIYTWRRAG